MPEICPSREELSAFHLGKLSPGALETVAEHLSACETCPAILDAITDGADPLLSELRKPVETEILSATECQRAVDLVEKIGAQLGAMPTEDQPEWGQLGQYQLLEKLGEGGMGQVFKARHQLMDRIVALKVINKKHLDNPEAVLRFHREIRALAQLDHPNIVRAHDADQVDDRHFLVMEYIEGTNLAKLVRRQGPLAVAQACAYIQQAGAGLQHAHEHGLVHRDIKPSNLIVTSSGQIKVLDLGLAKLREEQPVGDELTAAGQLMGTLDYMAPEQWEDTHAVDIRADIYSLGCTLYHLLTGKPPFGGPEYNSALKKMKAHAEVAVPPIRERRPDVPDTLAAVVHRMLAKNPAQRYATPAEFSAALQSFTNLPLESEQSTQTWSAANAAEWKHPLPPGGEGGVRGSNRFRTAWQRACNKRPILNRVRLGMALATMSVLLVAGVSVKLTVDYAQSRREATTEAKVMVNASAEATDKFDPTTERFGAAPTPVLIAPDMKDADEGVWIVRMRIGHYRSDPPKSLGDIGVASFETQVEDDVKVRAELSGPAYCYLIAYNPDGKEQLCYPEAGNAPPAPVKSFEYPSEPTKYFGLTKKEGTGPQAFVLLASAKPLPAYKEWRKKAGRTPWDRDAAMYEGVLRFDGHGEPVQLVGTRGEVRERTFVTKWALDFFNFFRDRKDVDAVKVMIFPVKAKAEKKGPAKSKEKIKHEPN